MVKIDRAIQPENPAQSRGPKPKGSEKITEQFIYKDAPILGQLLAASYDTTRPLIEALALRRAQRERWPLTPANLGYTFSLAQSTLKPVLNGTYATRLYGPVELKAATREILGVLEVTDSRSIEAELIQSFERRNPKTVQQRRRAERIRQEEEKFRQSNSPADFQSVSLDRCTLAIWDPRMIADLKILSRTVNELIERFAWHVLGPTQEGNIYSEDEVRNDAIYDAQEKRGRDVLDFLDGRYAILANNTLELTLPARKILVASGVRDLLGAEQRLLKAYAFHNSLNNKNIKLGASSVEQFASNEYPHVGPPTRLIESSLLYREAPELGKSLSEKYQTFAGLIEAAIQSRVERWWPSEKPVTKIFKDTIYDIAADVYIILDGNYAEHFDDRSHLKFIFGEILADAGLTVSKELERMLITIAAKRDFGADHEVQFFEDEDEGEEQNDQNFTNERVSLRKEGVERQVWELEEITIVSDGDEIAKPQSLAPRKVTIESDDDRYIPELDRRYFVVRLKQMRKDAIDHASIHRKELGTLPHEGSADRANAASDLDNDFRALARYNEKIWDIDQALRRIEEGTFGECIDSGDEIPYSRLVANPLALRTVEAEELRERRGVGRHVSSPPIYGLGSR